MWVIRDGCVDEHEILIRLQRRACDIWPDDVESPPRPDLELRHLNAGRVRVIEGDELVLGFAVLLAREGEDCRLEALFTDPEGWRRGVGRALVGDAVQLARAEGASGLSVCAGGQGARFYAHLGFKPTLTALPTGLMRLDLASTP